MNIVPRHSLLDFDRFFDGFWAPTSANEKLNTLMPRVDIKELESQYEITADLPGVDKDDIHITLDQGILTLEAATNQESNEEKDGKVIRQERHYGRISRSFNLGSNVQQSDITASFDNGVLTLTAPKTAPQELEAHRIQIQ